MTKTKGLAPRHLIGHLQDKLKMQETRTNNINPIKISILMNRRSQIKLNRSISKDS